jgi:formamidopyrimidine-DNA glycosylase
VPELPDVTVYVEALQQRLIGQTLTRIRLGSPFVLRTVEPSPSEVAGRAVVDIRRLGKRIVIELDGGLFIVIHLMIAGDSSGCRPARRSRAKSGWPRSTSPTGHCC